MFTMEKEAWLQDFEAKLKQNKLIYRPELKPLAYYQWLDKNAPEYQTQLYKTDKLIMTSESYAIVQLDLKSRLHKGACLESVLLNRKYVCKPLVINNQLLDDNDLGYHVVYLDGAMDFINHYYEKALTYQDNVKNSTVYSQYLAKTIGCLLFLNSDNSYFMALPCIMTADLALTGNVTYDLSYQNIKFDKLAIAYANTTINQIEQLLKPVPLYEYKGCYPFRLYLTVADTIGDPTLAYQASYLIHNEAVIDYEDGVYNQWVYDKTDIKPMMQWGNVVKAANTNQKFFNLLLFNSLLYCNVIRQNDYLHYYLDDTFQTVRISDLIKVNEQGLIEFNFIPFGPSFPLISKCLSDHLNQHLHSLSYPLNIKTSFNEIGQRELCSFLTEIEKLLDDNEITQITVPESMKIEKKELAVPPAMKANQSSAGKPLTTNKNFMSALTSISVQNQKFYYLNNHLLTITGSKTINAGKMCQLWNN